MIPVKLSKSITAHGETLDTLELKDPTFEQIQKFGLPVVVESSGNYGVNAAVAMKYIPELAAVPPSSIKDLHAYDINNLCWGVWRFFMTPPESSTES